MAYGDTKIVINSITYDNHSNNILVGVRKNPETEDSQTAEVVLVNADKRFTDLNLRGLTAVISYDYGSGYTATPTLTVMTQTDITSNGRYQTVLTLVGIPDLLSEDKASKDYLHDSTDTKTVEDLLTEVLDATPVASELTATQDTIDGFYNLHSGGIINVGQSRYIRQRTVKSIQFNLKKVGTPVGNVTFIMRPTDYSWTVTKVLSDASALTTSGTWYTATLDTERYVDDEVYIYCEYTSGQAPELDDDGTVLDAGDYVAVGYSSTAVATDENLVLQYAEGGWNVFQDQDCGYKFTYDIAGIECFSHTTSITLTVDSRDSLINVYQPGSSFRINEGESRLDIVNRLLDYTACYKRVENDDAVHTFIAPTSGNSYTSDKGDFYTHANQKALVVPSKIVVKSVDFEDDGFTGSATSAASFAIRPITGAPIRATVTGSAQAASIAAANISRLEVNSQVGSSSVPMTNYEQVWNYVTVTNNWNGSTTTGNIAYLNQVSMGGNFQQFFSFGRQARRGIGGSPPKREVKTEEFILDNTTLNWGMIKNIFGIIDENTDDLYEKINVIFLALEKIGVKVDYQEKGVTFEWVYSTLIQFLTDYYSLGEIVPRWQVTEQLIIPVR
ncbi:hypothetical protein LCGC14_1397290 [marine sediment metagenome]|uniref:Uncharacterized protein n=1 Tax=marine sediment metagenome TaxID=412755 RepID=A0A0F9JYB8_9ZZZZ